MKSHIEKCFFLQLLIIVVHSYPVPNQKDVEQCTISDADLTKLKSIIQSATAAKNQNAVNVLEDSSLEKCPMLKNITITLERISKDVIYLKSQSISDTSAEQAVLSTQEKIQEIVKSRDIFEANFKQESTRVQGEMAEKILALRNEIAELQREIHQTTNRMYEEMADLVFHSIQLNRTNTVNDYLRKVGENMPTKLVERLEKDKRIHYGAIILLTKLDDQKLMERFFTASMERLKQVNSSKYDELDIGKNVLVNMVCFAYDIQPKLNDVWIKQWDTMERAIKILFPTAWKHKNDPSDIKSRVMCNTEWPIELIVKVSQ